MNASGLLDAVTASFLALAAVIVPSILFVLAFIYFTLPLIAPNLEVTSFQVLIIMVGLILTLSFMLYAFNFPLIRFFLVTFLFVLGVCFFVEDILLNIYVYKFYLRIYFLYVFTYSYLTY